MASFRRNMSLQRDGTASPTLNGMGSRESSPSLKMYPVRRYLSFRDLMSSLANSMNPVIVLSRFQASICGCVFSQRSSRLHERSRIKSLYWRRIVFHFFVFFMAGVFISFMPFLSVDLHMDFMSKHKAFSFEDPDAESAPITLLRNAALHVEAVDMPNSSLDTVARQEIKQEFPKALLIPPSMEEPELLYHKLLIIVTPTYMRPFQAYYLHRLAHTLMNVPPPILWIVVEMSSQSPETAELLRNTGVMYRHLVCTRNVSSIGDNRVHQRNFAISHIEKHQLDGILYFADDDRVYSLTLFEQMRKISRFGTWPVAMLTVNRRRMVLEGPVCNGTEVTGWHTSPRLKMSRRFHVDISGFAFNSTILWDPKRWHRPTIEPIRQQHNAKESLRASMFIEQLVEDESQMEVLPDNCSEIMVWHLNLEAPDLSYPPGWLMEKNLEVVATLR